MANTKTANSIPQSHATPDPDAALLQLLFGLSKAKAEIDFPENFDISRAVTVLNMLDAVACAPGTIPYNKNQSNKTYSFVADKTQTKAVADKLKNKDFDDVQGKLYNPSLSRDFDELHQKAQKNNIDVIDTNSKNNTEKLNFLRFLCFYNIYNTPDSIDFRIFKQYILGKLAAIEAEQDESIQDKMITSLMQNLVFSENDLAIKNNMFADLGLLKFPNNKPSMKIFTDNNVYGDLFDLDLSQDYKLMHSLNISKLKQSFDFSNIEINGDFICKNQKKYEIKFPKKINGLFNCFGYGFAITRIPNGAITVNLEHAINSFAELNNIDFPTSTKDLIIKASIIRNVIKLLDTPGDDAELAACKEFIAKHPNIRVMDADGKTVLQPELQKPTPEKAPEIPEQSAQKAITQKPGAPEKTGDWLSPDEVKELVLTFHPEWQEISNFGRIIQRARNLNLDVRKQVMKHNNQDCLCIYRDDLEKLINNIQIILDKEINRGTKPKAHKTTDKPEEVKQQKHKKLKGIKLKKYIPAPVYKKIEKACGDSTALLVSVLERINQINHDYTSLASDTPLLHIDKYGNHQIISNTDHKRGKAAAIAIENNDNRRIVLTINPQDKIIVAIDFFLDHVNNAKQYKQYNDVALPNAAKGYLTDGKTPVTRDLVASNGYIDIDTKLKELKNTIKTKDVVVEQTQVVQTTTVTTTTTTTVVQHTSPKRPRIKKPVSVASGNYVPKSVVELIALKEKAMGEIALLEKYIQDLKNNAAPAYMFKELQQRMLEAVEKTR